MKLIERFRSFIGDPVLFGAVLTMTVFGVAMIYSATQMDVPQPGVAADTWERQAVWLGVSLIAFVLVARIQIRWFEWAAVPLYVVALLLLAVTLLIGVGRGTAASTRSWIDLGPLSFQPSQFANIATALILARVMGAWRESPRSLWTLWGPIAIVLVPMLLVLAQPDLGTAMVFGAMLIATMYWAGTPAGLLFLLISPLPALLLSFSVWLFSVYMLGLLLFLIVYRLRLWENVVVIGANLAAGTIAIPLWNALEEYQRNRLLVFLNPELDPRGAGYQLIQSQVAIGSGGLFGKGFLQGTQKRLAFLPEQHTDFIFAVIGEELGYIGALAVVGGFGLILWRLVKVAESTSDPFGGILAFAIFGAWLAHVLVNIGMTIGLMPITGIPLPFLSYGGSFLLATYIALAMAQRVASEQGRI
ncbi:MAG: rod shape-determining protein RodA [Longimicrobiales bacterium]